MTSKEISECKFSRAMSGYKLEEVDSLLDVVEADYERFEKTIKEMNAKTEALSKEVEEYKRSQNSIQNVLLNAQKLADQIIDDAKAQAEDIISEAKKELVEIDSKKKKITASIDADAEIRKAEVEKEIAEVLTLANKKNESITAATADSVARQQMLFDKLKLEVAEFKSAVMKAYKEHLDIINSLPDEVPMDPKYVAKIITTDLDKAPEKKDIIKGADTPALETAEPEENGFVVEEIKEPEEEEA